MEEVDYKETELPCENPLIRKWTNTDEYVWFTDLNCSYLGESLEEAIETFKSRMLKNA